MIPAFHHRAGVSNTNAHSLSVEAGAAALLRDNGLRRGCELTVRQQGTDRVLAVLGVRDLAGALEIEVSAFDDAGDCTIMAMGVPDGERLV